MGAILELLLVLWSLVGLWLLDRDRLPFVRFHRRALRETPLWRGGEAVLGLLVYLLVLIGVATVLFPLKEEGHLNKAVYNNLVNLGAVGMVCAFIFWTVSVVHGQPPRALGLQTSRVRNLAATVACYVLSVVPIMAFAIVWNLGLENVLGVEETTQEAVQFVQQAVREADVGTLVVLFGIGFIAAPVCEEIIFRGFLFGLLRARLGFTAALVISSLLFAILHGPAAGPIFVVGALLCYVYEHSGSLYYAMLYHAIFNGVNLAHMYLFPGVEQPTGSV